jgi:hypothetical protein
MLEGNTEVAFDAFAASGQAVTLQDERQATWAPGRDANF